MTTAAEALLPELNYDVPEYAIDRTTKRAITTHMRLAREFLSGAVFFIEKESDDETARCSIELAEEAVEEAK